MFIKNKFNYISKIGEGENLCWEGSNPDYIFKYIEIW